MEIKPSNESMTVFRESSIIIQYETWWLLERFYRSLLQSVQ